MSTIRKYLTPFENPYPHMGQLLAKRIKLAGFSDAEIARKLSLSANTVSAYSSSKSVQAGILWNIGIAIKHNFFAEIGKSMPVPFKDPDAEKLLQDFQQQLAAKEEQVSERDKEISEQARKISDLEKELAIYKSIVMSGK